LGIKQKQYIVSGFLREPGVCPSLLCSAAHARTNLATAPARRQRGPKPVLPPSHPYRLRSVPGRIRNPINLSLKYGFELLIFAALVACMKQGKG